MNAGWGKPAESFNLPEAEYEKFKAYVLEQDFTYSTASEERLKKMKEAGLKPKQKPKVIEPGNDDCGDDLTGLGKDIYLLGHDAWCENWSDTEEDDIFLKKNIRAAN